MPWCPLVGDHVAQMVIEDVDDLVIGDCVVMISSCGSIVRSPAPAGISNKTKLTEDICRGNLVLEVSSEMTGFRAGPGPLLNFCIAH